MSIHIDEIHVMKSKLVGLRDERMKMKRHLQKHKNFNAMFEENGEVPPLEENQMEAWLLRGHMMHIQDRLENAKVMLNEDFKKHTPKRSPSRRR